MTVTTEFKLIAFGVCNNNKWRRWMWIVAIYWQKHGPRWLAWSEGWRPPNDQSAFIKWTGKLAMVSPWWQHHKYYLGIIIITTESQI